MISAEEFEDYDPKLQTGFVCKTVLETVRNSILVGTKGHALQLSVKSGLPGGRVKVAVQPRQVLATTIRNTMKFRIFCYIDYCNNIYS
jgi:hypothetical protein